MNRIDNILDYIKKEFPNYTYENESYKSLDKEYAPLQKDYGETYDCSITTISGIIYDLVNRKFPLDEIYKNVESVAKKWLYQGEIWGTPFVFISNIYNTIAKKYKIPAKCKGRYLKNVGFNFEMIKLNIDCGKPIILNVYNDGHNYYDKHTVKIIGYNVVTIRNNGNGKTKKLHMLKVLDNWRVTPGYINYDIMSTISSINTI